MRVLIIEDEENLRHMMRLALEAGNQVGEAATGEAGLDLFGNGAGWDVVLLDQRLPGIDGLETFRRLKQRDAGVSVVMITAFASIELAVDAMKLGATDFLRKPVAPEALRGALAAALHMKTDRQAPRPAGTPSVVHMTLNGFQIVREPTDATASPYDHRFQVIQFATGERHPVTVCLDADEVERVARLTRKTLVPQGEFWRGLAERFLASTLWVDGRLPQGGRMTLRDLPRETIELAAAWEGN